MSFLSLSLGRCRHFPVFPICSFDLSVFIFNAWLLKQEKPKVMEGEKSNGTLNLLELTSQEGRGLQQWEEGQQQWPSASLHLSGQKSSQHRYPLFWGQSPFSDSWLSKVCASCFRHMYTGVCLLLGWGICSYCAKSWNCPKMTTINSKPSPRSCKPSQTPHVYKSFIRQICQCNYCLGGEADSWCFLLYQLPRILDHWLLKSGLL